MVMNSESSVLIRALEDLDERLYKLSKGKIATIELNVVGGFALMMNNVRIDPSEITDIDYIGESFSNEIKEIVDAVGVKHNIGKGWINNDVLLDGSSLEELEFIVGKLKFKKVLELKVFKINICRPEDIVRMKLIAIDTSVMTVSNHEDFSRERDFYDMKRLMEFLKWNLQDIKNEGEDYVIMPETFTLIEEFIKTGSNKLIATGKI